MTCETATEYLSITPHDSHLASVGGRYLYDVSDTFGDGELTEHLSTLGYKIQEDTEKLQQVERRVSEQQSYIDLKTANRFTDGGGRYFGWTL